MKNEKIGAVQPIFQVQHSTTFVIRAFFKNFIIIIRKEALYLKTSNLW